MTTVRVAVSIVYDYSGVPKGCRKPRSMQGTRLAVVDLAVGTPSRFPVAYTVTHRGTERRGAEEAEVVSVLERRWGEGQLWCPVSSASGDDIAPSLSQRLHATLPDRYTWRRMSVADIQTAIDKGIAQVQTSFRVIGGLLFQPAVEHVWVVNDPSRYRQSVEIELSEEPKGESVFRLDELEAAKAAAAASVAKWRTNESPEVTIDGEATVVRPDLLKRPSGRVHAAKVRSWKVIESVRETNQLVDRLERWLADPVHEALPMGLSIEEGKRLHEVLVQMRRQLAGITDEQIATNDTAA